MRFGSAKRDEKVSGEGGKYAKTFKDNETQIRFLNELDEWYSFWDHFDAGKKRSFPCTNDRDTCPARDADGSHSRASKRYLVNALVKGYVDVWKVPTSLMKALTRAYDKDGGSIMKREYTVVKSGTGMDTEYLLESESRSTIDVEQYEDKFQDFEELLMSQYVEAWGDPDVPGDFDEDQSKPKAKPKVEAKSENPPFEPDPPKEGSKYDEDPPTEPKDSAEQGESEDDEEILSEEQLRAMPEAELVELYGRCGIEVPEEMLGNTTALADNLIKLLG